MIKDNIKRLRILVGSQKELARLVDVGISTVQHWESGTRTPSRQNREKLLRVAGNGYTRDITVTLKPGQRLIVNHED